MADVLESKIDKSWNRAPSFGEILVISKNSAQPHAHSLRRPAIDQDCTDPTKVMDCLLSAKNTACWCGWRFNDKNALIEFFTDDCKRPLCRRCFGEPVGITDACASESTSSSDSSEHDKDPLEMTLSELRMSQVPMHELAYS